MQKIVSLLFCTILASGFMHAKYNEKATQQLTDLIRDELYEKSTPAKAFITNASFLKKIEQFAKDGADLRVYLIGAKSDQNRHQKHNSRLIDYLLQEAQLAFYKDIDFGVVENIVKAFLNNTDTAEEKKLLDYCKGASQAIINRVKDDAQEKIDHLQNMVEIIE